MAKTTLKTPVGTLQWTQVFESVKSIDPAKPNLWKVDLVMPWQQEAYDFSQLLEQKCLEEHGQNPRLGERSWPFKMEVIDGKDTGNIIFTFKRNVTNNSGRPVSRPIVVDSMRQKWPSDKLIGNGSTGVIAYSAFGWKNAGICGISLYLEALQVLDFVPYESLDPDSFFDEMPGHYVVAEEEPDESGHPFSPPAPPSRSTPAPGPVQPPVSSARTFGPPGAQSTARPWNPTDTSTEEVPYQ